jgi:hypothetical protein
MSSQAYAVLARLAQFTNRCASRNSFRFYSALRTDPRKIFSLSIASGRNWNDKPSRSIRLPKELVSEALALCDSIPR